MNSIGTINTSLIVEYNENCENFENLDNKFIVKVKSSSLDDVIILFKEPNFERFIREAFNCFIVCVEFDSIEEEEDDDDDDEYTALRLQGIFKADRLIILQLSGNLWIKKCLQRKFFNMKCTKMRKYHKLLEDINYGDDFLSSELKLNKALNYIKQETEDFEIKTIKLFKFDNQKKVDQKFFDKAFEQKCSFEVIHSMISFHKNMENSLTGMNRHEVDALFWAKGIKVFDEEVIEYFKHDLKIEDKEKITDEIEKFHGNQKSLLQHLCSRSRIALSSEGTEDEKLQRIEGFYRSLIDLDLDSVTELLKIVDHKLLIIFDFESNSIERSYLMGSRHNRGIFDQDRVKIYIGANNSHKPLSQDYITRQWEIMGILIHEICHYVNFKVFNNNCKPYHKEGKDIKEYEETVNDYKNRTNQHEIVGRVFTDYEDTMWHAELIVRIIQMIVTYKNLDPDNLEKLEKKYQKLFSYFNDTVMTQVKEFLDPNNQLKRQIKEVSSFRLDQIELKPVMKPINYDKEKFIHFIETNSPKLALTNFFENFANDLIIFTSFKDLIDEVKGNNILQLWCSDWRIKIVIFVDQIDESSRHFEDCIKKLDNPDRLNHIFIIFEEQSGDLTKLKGKFTKRVEILEKLNFGFTDLTEESKDMILQRNVIFQGSQTTLDKIIRKDSNAAQFLPINHFLKSSDPIVIGRMPEKNADYDDKVFIQRKLTSKIGEQVVEFSTENMDKILELLSKEKYIIISDEVGKGKSTLMTYLAYQFLHSTLPHINGKFFVVKINLHQHVNELEGYKDKMDLNRFIFDQFIRKSDFNEFEWKVFEEFYQEGKLVLMLDGFDEIAPNCEEQTFKIIHKIVNSMTSNVIVATRPLFLQKLSIYNAFILNLELLSTQDQLDFLINFLNSVKEIRDLYSEAVRVKLCNKTLFRIQISISESIDSKGAYTNAMMSFPLHLRMFADVISNKLLKKKSNFDEDALNSIIYFNAYNLYDDFFEIKQNIALKDKGEVVENEINSLERKGFKRLQLFECAGKLAWNTFHPAFKTNPITIDEEEKKYLQRYGIVTMRNNEIYFVHRSYAEYLMAYMFLKNVIDGTLSSSNFAQDHFWIDVLTLRDYVIIKSLIDIALSNEFIYNIISEAKLEQLGKFIIKQFEELEGNDKNFLHCVVEHDKKIRMGSIRESGFVFVSHLLFHSLMYCHSEEDIATIKEIIEKPWDVNSANRFDLNSEINIFHLCCLLGFNCLVSTIWKLAKKVYGNNVKHYFFRTSLFDNKMEIKVLEHALHSCASYILEETVVNIRKCYQIEELRKLEYINDNQCIDVNEDCNFEQSTPYLLLQIIKKLNLSENELESVCPPVSEWVNHLYEKNIFFNLNFYLHFISNFFPKGHPKNEKFLVYKISKVTSNFIKDTKENVEEEIVKVLKFLKEKLLDQYELFLIQVFALSFQTDWVTLVWQRYLTKTKARILYSELKELDFKHTNIITYFQYYPYFFSSYLSQKEKYSFKTFRKDLEMFFNILDEDHLILLLLNEGFENCSIIIHVVSKFQMGCLEQLLNLLESRFVDKEKLYYVVDKSKMLKYAFQNQEKFSKIFEFCKKNFEKSIFLNLVFTVEHGCKLILKNPNICNEVFDFFMDVFDDETWKIFYYQVNKNKATIILVYLNFGWIKSAKILIKVARQKLSKLQFYRLMHFRDKDNNSIVSVKDQKKLDDIDTSVNFCTIL